MQRMRSHFRSRQGLRCAICFPSGRTAFIVCAAVFPSMRRLLGKPPLPQVVLCLLRDRPARISAGGGFAAVWATEDRASCRWGALGLLSG